MRSSPPSPTRSCVKPGTFPRSTARGFSHRSKSCRCSPREDACWHWRLSMSGSGEVVGGGTLHHLDSERRIVEIGYFVLPHARGRGVATAIARLLAEHAFALGLE